MAKPSTGRNAGPMPDMVFGRPTLAEVRDVAEGLIRSLPVEPWQFSEGVDRLLVGFGPYAEGHHDMAQAFFAGALASFIFEWGIDCDGPRVRYSGLRFLAAPEPEVLAQAEMCSGQMADLLHSSVTWRCTPGIRASDTNLKVAGCVERFLRGDWGDVSVADWKHNDEARRVLLGDGALQTPSSRIGSYQGIGGVDIWVYQNEDEIPTVMLPCEWRGGEGR